VIDLLLPKIRNKDGNQFLVLIFGIVLEVQGSTIRQEKEIKGIHIRKEE
jgi:hypothetical protein